MLNVEVIYPSFVSLKNYQKLLLPKLFSQAYPSQQNTPGRTTIAEPGLHMLPAEPLIAVQFAVVVIYLWFQSGLNEECRRRFYNRTGVQELRPTKSLSPHDTATRLL